MLQNLAQIVSQFQLEGNLIDVAPYQSGHINDTYVSRWQWRNAQVRYIHQRINHHVFKTPEDVMENIARVTRFARQQIIAAGGDAQRETLNLIPTRDDQTFYKTPDGEYWRTYVFIEGARAYDTPQNLDHLYRAAHAFGRFQKLVSTLPGERLRETIPDFHHTPSRFATFLRALKADVKHRAASVKPEIDFALKREAETGIIVTLLAQGKLPERVIHNDTKLNNVLIDDQTGKGICVIDLDTVMPGSALYDFGDAVRAGASTASEDECDLSKVDLSLELFERLAHGYLDATRGFLTDPERMHLALAAKLLTLEQGIRFLTDYLNGDVYYKIQRADHNLDRCRTQFKLVARMEHQMERMQSIVDRGAHLLFL
jgi:hypothetical protein